MAASIRESVTALALAGAVALTAVTAPAAPARADNEEIAGVIAGLAALFIIGRAIEQHNDRNQPVTRNVPPPLTHRPHPPQPQVRLIAPARCYRDFGTVRGYLAQCMQQNVARPGLLPPECITRVHTNHGPRNLFAGRCLARFGWQREPGFHP
ncbi:hypothetical protein HKCCE2091_13135 [Rhodobacterales bacterium HKCCE2091]|nr:hypothetical protein [Rhodobacterales bacterium HKCCE2091]